MRRRRKNSRRMVGRGEERGEGMQRKNSPGLQGQFLHGVPELTNSPL